jgi:bacillithiol biosynthesis cysteine-adding enzyme BshC
MIRLEHLSADVLELPPFARAALSGRLAPELVSVPRNVAEFPRLDERFDAEAREDLAATLERGLAPLAPHVRVLDAVRSLQVPGACAIVTGQQPGFLASPLYSLYKALQSIRLARMLTERWERPVIALFWNHADDHDVAEVHHAHVVNKNLDLQKIALAGLSSGRMPLSRIVLDDDAHRLGPIRAALAQLVEGEPFAQRALEAFVPRSGETFARAFTRAMTELLGVHGLVVLEPDWIRAPMSRELARIVGADPFPHLVRGAEAVKAADLPVAIEPQGAALLFALDDQGRHALRAGGDGFQYDGESGSRTPAELAAEIVQDPLAWSPGALLRPLVQDLVLPVAAYVGGFGELAYHAELGPLRARVGAPRTPFVPRLSMTLVDPESRAALRKLDASVADVLRARGAFTAEGAEVPAPEVVDKMRRVARDAARELSALRSELAELDPGLAVQLKRACDQVEDLVDKLAEKAERVQQNKSGKGKRHERRINNVLFPRNEPQERVLGPMTFVARFGEEWIGALLDEIDPLGSEHVLVHLGADAPAEGRST